MKYNYKKLSREILFLFCVLFIINLKYVHGHSSFGSEPLETLNKAEGETLNIRVVDHYLWTGRNTLDNWAVFPDSTKRYEKIIMHYRLECPTGGCGEWDYISGIYILTENGPLEIGRFITPFGKWFAAGRQFDWVFDITDYAYLLRDSVQLRTTYDGDSQGSLFTLDIEMKEGIPPKDVFRIETIYNGVYEYGNPDKPIESNLPEKTITIEPQSVITTLKITTTGHGFGGTENAAEYSDKTHTVNINGTQRFTQHLWRDDCGQNPVYPQAGTWYYNRAGWCPGDAVRPFYFDLSPFVNAGQNAKIDYNMEPFINLDLSHPANYMIDVQVIYAHAANFQNDAAITEIRKPNSEFRYRRMNPICDMAEPEIGIKNTGKNDLTSLTIRYGIDGDLSHSYNWTGFLKFMETETVNLPAINLGSEVAEFTATVSNPNNIADEYASNNSLTVPYDIPATFKSPVIMKLITDNFYNSPETTNGIVYDVRDIEGNILYADSGFMDSGTILDTFNFIDGCYQFTIYDKYLGDGLFPITGTPGSYVLKDADDNIIINALSASPDFLSSFGDREITTFMIETPTGIKSNKIKESLNIFPNPGTGIFKVDLRFISEVSDCRIRVYSITGQCITRQNYKQITGAFVSLDLSTQPDGIYYVSVEAGNEFRSKRIIKTSGK